MLLEIHKNYVDEIYDAEGNLSSFSLHCPDDFNFAYDVLDVLATKTPHRRAMRYVDDRGSCIDFTFAQMKQGSDNAASYFQSIGIGKGDTVMLIMRRHYQFWFTLLGLHKIGAIAVPASFQIKASDVSYRLEKAEIKAFVCTAEGNTIEEVEEALDAYAKPVQRIIVRGERAGWTDLDAALMTAAPFEKPAKADLPVADDTMLLYFTSGTEGQPKMVDHSYRYPIAHIPSAKYWQNVQPDGLHLTVSDTGWMKSVWGKLYGQWLMEAGVFVYDFNIFNPSRMLRHMADNQVTTFCAPPTTYRYLLSEDLSEFDLSALSALTTAGEALPADVFNKTKEAFGLEMKEGFGQSETVLSCATYHWMPAKPGSMGKPTGTYPVVLLDGEGQEITEAHVPGEICIRVEREEPQIGIFKGYRDAEELTAKTWHDGYYHTHDEAYLDEDGYYWYVGRLDDMIKTSGFRVGPFEVESVILEHEAVLECAVTGAPDEHRGQAIKASIVLRPGYEPTKELEQNIKKFARSRIASYKSPRIIEFLEELPKTVSGKIRRTALRNQD